MNIKDKNLEGKLKQQLEIKKHYPNAEGFCYELEKFCSEEIRKILDKIKDKVKRENEETKEYTLPMIKINQKNKKFIETKSIPLEYINKLIEDIKEQYEIK